MRKYFFEVERYQPVCSKIPPITRYSSKKQLREYSFAEIVAFAEVGRIYSPNQSSIVAHEFLPGSLPNKEKTPHRDQIRFYINGEIIARIMDISDLTEQCEAEDFFPTPSAPDNKASTDLPKMPMEADSHYISFEEKKALRRELLKIHPDIFKTTTGGMLRLLDSIDKADEIAIELGQALRHAKLENDNSSNEMLERAVTAENRFATLVELMKSAGIEAFARERKRQIEKEGFTPKYDMQHSPEELVNAAICYATHPSARRFKQYPRYKDSIVIDHIFVPALWPWDSSQWKPSTRKRDLEKAGALLAAAYDLKEAQMRNILKAGLI